MSSARELISSTTRGRFRDLTTGSTHGRITAAFQDEGFAPNPDSTWDDGSVRRTTAQHYLEAVNWADPGHVTRALRAMARIMDEFEDQYTESLRKELCRDACQLDDDGRITLPVAQLPRMPLDGLRDPAAILDNLDRIARAIVDDPAQAIGSAQGAHREHRQDRLARTRPDRQRERRHPRADQQSSARPPPASLGGCSGAERQ